MQLSGVHPLFASQDAPAPHAATSTQRVRSALQRSNCPPRQRVSSTAHAGAKQRPAGALQSSSFAQASKSSQSRSTEHRSSTGRLPQRNAPGTGHSAS
jgi:hypothetical protein